MNVLLIHQAFAAPTEPGGSRHFELGRHLVRRGHGFDIVASNVSYLTGEQVTAANAPFSTLDGVRVHRTYAYRFLHRSFVWRVVSFLSFMCSSFWTALRMGPPDIVMGTTPPIFQTVSAWAVAVLRRKPFLLEVRDLWPEFAIELGVLKNPLLIGLSRWLERFLYARATHILVNSPAYREYLVAKGVSIEKITLIANGVDPEMFDPAAKGECFRQEWKADGQFVVTYAGALGLANDIPTLLRAAERLLKRPAIRFVIAGDGKERGNIQEQVRAKGLTNVTLIGARPKSEMTEILAASDACVAVLQDVPMFTTTYPNKVFDYMAAGRPTILAIDGVIREVIDAAGGGIFVPPGNDVELAAAIEFLSSNRPTAKAMGRAARAHVAQHFNRRHQGGQFVSLLEHLVAPEASRVANGSDPSGRGRVADGRAL